MKFYNFRGFSSAAAIWCFTAVFLASISLQASNVGVDIEKSTDGITWASISPDDLPLQAVTALTTYYRVSVVPSGGTDPSVSSPIAVDMPAIGGHVEVELQSSTDLQGWSGATPGTIAVSQKEFYRVVAKGFAEIPADSFFMGDTWSDSDPDGNGDSDELAVHSVILSKFFIQITEVTKAEWDDVTAWAASNGYDDLGDSLADGKGSTHPVHSVSWYDCVKFANACSERAGLTPVYSTGGSTYRTGVVLNPDIDFSANGYRLPTEAEWERAARGGQAGFRFPWGNTISHNEANFLSSDGSIAYDLSTTTNAFHPDYDDDPWPATYTSPVGEFSSNNFGLYDIIGNLREWCFDWYSDSYYNSSDSAGPDPIGPGSGFFKVARGGSWANSPLSCRLSARLFHFPTLEFEDPDRFGFRLVRNSLQ